MSRVPAALGVALLVGLGVACGPERLPLHFRGDVVTDSGNPVPGALVALTQWPHGGNCYPFSCGDTYVDPEPNLDVSVEADAAGHYELQTEWPHRGRPCDPTELRLTVSGGPLLHEEFFGVRLAFESAVPGPGGPHCVSDPQVLNAALQVWRSPFMLPRHQTSYLGNLQPMQSGETRTFTAYVGNPEKGVGDRIAPALVDQVSWGVTMQDAPCGSQQQCGTQRLVAPDVLEFTAPGFAQGELLKVVLSFDGQTDSAIVSPL